MNSIRSDLSGELLSGIFYEINTPFGDSDFRKPPPEGWIASLMPDWHEYIYSELLCRRKPIHGCRADAEHVTGYEKEYLGIDLFGRNRVPDFLYNSVMLDTVVSQRLADLLPKSGLTGVKAVPVKIDVNQSKVRDPKLCRLEISGAGCERAWKISTPDGNTCPFCNWGPVVCPGCGDITYECPTCKEEIIASERKHKGKGDRRWLRELVPSKGRVMDGAKWDGSDFFGAEESQGFMTGRAVKWLVSIHAAPFFAVPCRVNVAGLDRVQRDRIEAARGGIKGDESNY